MKPIIEKELIKSKSKSPSSINYISIAALTENRAKEIGVAIYMPIQNKVILSQLINDSSTKLSITLNILAQYGVKILIMCGNQVEAPGEMMQYERAI